MRLFIFFRHTFLLTLAAAGLLASGLAPAHGQADPAPAAVGATGTPVTKAGASAAAMNKADQAILKSMAQAQLNEIAAGKQALDISKTDSVRKFAQTMVDDHSKALESITTLAAAKKVTLPTEPDAAHKAMAAKMQKMTGDGFDKAYIKEAGVNDHSKVHSALQKNAAKAKDADLKALMTTMAPTVAAHLDAAKSLQNGGATAAR